MLDLSQLLRMASDEKASDVHITVGVSPKIRVHGVLQSTNFPKMTTADTLEVLLGIVNPEQRERFEETGEIDLSVSIPDVGRYRVNAYKQRSSIALALRLVDMEIPEAEDLHIPEEIMNLCSKKRGMILVTGPSGSGKSTLLAAMIDCVNSTREAHIITLEDPIEYLHQHKMSMVNQREIGLDTKNYEKALRAALREDPDVLQVSELNDDKVLSMAMTAAETGRLVFSSAYTIGAVETIESLIEMYPIHQQKQARTRLANVLRAIVCRQLPTAADGTHRIPAYEILIANNEVKDLIRRGKYEELEKVMLTKKAGMTTMDQYLTDLYSEGMIDKSTAIQFAKDQESMTEKLQ